MEGVVIKELVLYSDERGWLVEAFREDESGHRPVMSYVSMTKPGIVRGPHEHIEQTDCFCFFGNFRLYLWDNRKNSQTFGKEIIFESPGKPYIAIVPPGVVHAYKNTGDSDGIVINMPDRLFKGRGRELPVDEIRYEDDPHSPYRTDR